MKIFCLVLYGGFTCLTGVLTVWLGTVASSAAYTTVRTVGDPVNYTDE